MSKNWILIRGLARGNQHWGDIPRRLEKHGCEVELLEIPGNGHRVHEMSPIKSEILIQSFAKESSMFQKSETVNLCGISLGGMLALKWAELMPGRIHSATLINSSLRQLSPVHQRLLPSSYFKLLKILTTKRAQNREQKILELTTNFPQNHHHKIEVFSKLSPTSRWNFLRQLLLASEIEIQKKKITVPILILSSLQDRLVHPNCSSALASHLQSRILHHPNAGHDLPLDAPDWLAETLVNVSPE